MVGAVIASVQSSACGSEARPHFFVDLFQIALPIGARRLVCHHDYFIAFFLQQTNSFRNSGQNLYLLLARQIAHVPQDRPVTVEKHRRRFSPPFQGAVPDYLWSEEELRLSVDLEEMLQSPKLRSLP